MTISYSGNFAALIFRWKGSVIKTLWREVIVYFFFFFVVRMILQFGSANGKETAIWTVELFYSFTKAVNIPLTVFLGFFVTVMVIRWSQIVKHVPWPDDIMLLINAYIPGGVKDDKLKRHTIARYLLLCQVLVFRDLSTKVRMRFPRLIEVANAGLMTLDEYQLHQETTCSNIRWQLPLQWAINGILSPMVGKQPGCIHPKALVQIIDEINVFRNSLYSLHIYNWICIPLVYSQALAVVVYGYFAFALVGHQYLGKPADPVIPFLTILQFIFYIGWLKVGEKLMRPFGDDDDDLEMNFFLDRHAMVSMYLSDQVCDNNPPTVEDKFFGLEGNLNFLPYTKFSTLKGRNHPPKSHALIELKNRQGMELWERKTAVAPVVHEANIETPLLKETKRRSMYF